MASSPTPPNHRSLIYNTIIDPLLDDDDDHDDRSMVPPATCAVRLSYESSPLSKIRKAVDHATPPRGGESPHRQSRRMGDLSCITLPFKPVAHDCHFPLLRLPSLGGTSPTSITNPPLVSQTQTMDDLITPLESLAAVVAAT